MFAVDGWSTKGRQERLQRTSQLLIALTHEVLYHSVSHITLYHLAERSSAWGWIFAYLPSMFVAFPSPHYLLTGTGTVHVARLCVDDLRGVNVHEKWYMRRGIVTFILSLRHMYCTCTVHTWQRGRWPVEWGREEGEDVPRHKRRRR